MITTFARIVQNHTWEGVEEREVEYARIEGVITGTEQGSRLSTSHQFYVVDAGEETVRVRYQVPGEAAIKAAGGADITLTPDVQVGDQVTFVATPMSSRPGYYTGREATVR